MEKIKKTHGVIMEKIKNGIIKLLGENARYTAKQIADMLGEDEQTIKALIGELEESGIIVKYAAILNADALQDTRVKALIEVKVAPQKLKGFDHPVQGTLWFTYKGEKLTDLRDRIDAEK
jgi:DNA-binding Lrp family transcriptional regulator